MAIDINYKVTGLETLEGSLNNLANSLNTLQTALTGTKNQESNVGSNKNQNVNTATSDVIHSDRMFKPGSDNKITDAIDSSVNKSTKQNESFFSKLDKLTQSLDKLNQSNKDLVDVSGKGGKTKDTDNPDDAATKNSSKSNINKGLILGTEALVAYQAQSFGGVIGSTAQSINTGLANYSDFERDYHSRLISSERSAASTGGYVVGASAINLAASLTPTIPGKIFSALVAAGLTAYGEYRIGTSAEKSQAQNSLIANQDNVFYRLSSLGYSKSGTQLNASALFGEELAKTNLTNLQKQSMDSKGYIATLGETVFGGRRDVIGDLNTTNTLSKFNDNLNNLSLLTGVGVGNLSSIVTQYSKVSGSSVDETLKQLRDNFAEFGGDTASNTAEMVKLLQSTSMSPAEARRAVNTLQYNDTALANLIGVKSASPFNSFAAYVLGKQLGGLSDKELDTGVLSDEHRNELIKAQTRGRHGILDTNSIISTYRMLGLGQIGADAFATSAGNIESSQSRFTNTPYTDLIKEFNKQLIDSLGEIKVDTQNVNNPSQVNIYTKNGNVKTNGIPSKTGRKYVDNGIY